MPLVESLFRATPQGTAADGADSTTTTDANGDWSLSIAPFAPGDDRDVIVVQYTGSPLAPDFIATGSGGNALTESGWTGFFDLKWPSASGAGSSRSCASCWPFCWA